MNLTVIRDATPEDAPQIYALLLESGWGHRLSSELALHELLAASQRKVVAVIDGKVVGFVRAITDGLSNGYLSMVAVSAQHRKNGLGSSLVQHVVSEGDGITWVLRAGRPEAKQFFSSLGFAVSTEAMELRRRENAANPSIERTSPGKPGTASHFQR
jgi:ribosomal protein S18 acetylase RimI-like enzyme